MEFVHFDVDANLRETTRHGSENFPVAIYLQQLNKNKDGFVILHWHDEIQFVIPRNGSILYRVSEQEYTVTTNSALFINSKRLHMAKPEYDLESSYICIDIHPKLIYGYANSIIN